MADPVHYQVRTPMGLWIANGLLAGFSVLVIGAMLFVGNVPPSVMVLAFTLCAATVAFWLSMSAYRVGGGRNLIRIYDDRIEVPAVHERQPIAFAREGISIDVRDVMVEWRLGLTSLGRIRRGRLIEVRSGGKTRKFSTLVLADPHDEKALLGDLQRFLTGQSALGRAAYDVPAPRTEYDDRIDRELAQLD